MKSEPVTRERVDAAIFWYRQHKAEIKSALPLEVPGLTFQAGWVDSLEKQIELWESGSSPLKLAEIYIHCQLGRVALALMREKDERGHLVGRVSRNELAGCSNP